MWTPISVWLPALMVLRVDISSQYPIPNLSIPEIIFFPSFKCREVIMMLKLEVLIPPAGCSFLPV